MAKDPAILLYNDKWSASTAGMKSEYRAWYLDLILYQFNNGYIPDDEDMLAGICHVLPSEYLKFTHFITQVLMQKFKKCEDRPGYKNDVADEIIRKREKFKEKRSKSGIIGNIIKRIKKLTDNADNECNAFVSALNKYSISELNELNNNSNTTQVRDVLRTHLRALYINVNEDEDVIINYNSEMGGMGGKAKRFSKPDITDVEIEFMSQGSTINESRMFYDYYESNGWMVGRNKMKNWQSAARNWIARNNKSDMTARNYRGSPTEKSKTASMLDGMDDLLQKMNSEITTNGHDVKQLA